MSKALCWVGLILSLIVFLIFLLDVSAAIPFGRRNIFVDVIFMVIALLMMWMSWTTYREQK